MLIIWWWHHFRNCDDMAMCMSLLMKLPWKVVISWSKLSNSIPAHFFHKEDFGIFTFFFGMILMTCQATHITSLLLPSRKFSSIIIPNMSEGENKNYFWMTIHTVIFTLTYGNYLKIDLIFYKLTTISQQPQDLSLLFKATKRCITTIWIVNRLHSECRELGTSNRS